MLNGRILPDLYDDLKRKGLILDHMYEKISVPVDSIDCKRFSSHWKLCVRDNAAKFKISIPDRVIDTALDRILENQYVDFAILDENFQKQVLLNILSDRQYRSRFLSSNPFLPELAQLTDIPALIHHNRRVVESEFGRSRYQEQLLKIYQKVMQYTVRHTIDKAKLAGMFLNPKKISLLKWDETNV